MMVFRYILGLVNPRRMRSEGYSSQFVCVCVCLYLCYCANCYIYLICKAKLRHASQGSLWRFTDLQQVDFAKNTLFKGYGVTCIPPLPSTLPKELSMDRRNSSELFLRRRVCTLSDSLCSDVQCEIATKLLSLACAYHVLAGLAHVSLDPAPLPTFLGVKGLGTRLVHSRAITYSVHSCVYSSQYIFVPCTLLAISLLWFDHGSDSSSAIASLPCHGMQTKANKLSMH